MGTLGILKVGPCPGVISVSRRRGVPSIEPQVISGEASTPAQERVKRDREDVVLKLLEHALCARGLCNVILYKYKFSRVQYFAD